MRVIGVKIWNAIDRLIREKLYLVLSDIITKKLQILIKCSVILVRYARYLLFLFLHLFYIVIHIVIFVCMK